MIPTGDPNLIRSLAQSIQTKVIQTGNGAAKPPLTEGMILQWAYPSGRPQVGRLIS